jgi:mono/diheme cytochrome c family protein
MLLLALECCSRGGPGPPHTPGLWPVSAEGEGIELPPLDRNRRRLAELGPVTPRMPPHQVTAEWLGAPVLPLPSPAPAGVTESTVLNGQELFLGKGHCHMCHGDDARGTGVAPDLTGHRWIHISGAYRDIVGLIKGGVPRPRFAPLPMPARGKGHLSDGEVNEVAGFVWSLSRSKGEPLAAPPGTHTSESPPPGGMTADSGPPGGVTPDSPPPGKMTRE